MKILRLIVKSSALLGATLLLTGCKLAVLNSKGPVAAEQAKLLIDATLLMLIIVIPVILMSFVFAWRYRASNTKAIYKPDDAHNNMLEAICWFIPCIIIIILAVMTWRYTHKLDPYRPLDEPGKTITIQAIALNWKWLFIYPEQGIASVNYVNIPVNTKIQFLITSDAPMNSFEVPQLAGQIYAMAGMRTKLNLMATEIGNYSGLSTNYSGDGFSDMHFTVQVTSLSEFDAWVAETKKSPNQLTLAAYSKLAQNSENNPVQYFSNPAQGLFDKVLMKFMMPMPDMVIAHDGDGTIVTWKQ